MFICQMEYYLVNGPGPKSGSAADRARHGLWVQNLILLLGATAHGHEPRLNARTRHDGLKVWATHGE